MSDLSPATVLGTLAAGALIKHLSAAYIASKDFVYVGKISELHVWPVKSCGGLKVDKGQCEHTGLFYGGIGDRTWVIVSPDGGYVTQRQEPKMALIKIRLQGNILILEAPGMPTLELPTKPQTIRSQVGNVKIKVDTTEFLDCGEKSATWINKYLGRQGLKIGFSAPDLHKRDAITAEKLWKHNAKKGDMLAFSDYSSYMLMSAKSMDVLNSKLKKPVYILNFRPNFVVEGCEAFDEEHWSEVKIGNVKFRNIDDCTRCLLTTVDPYTGEKSKEEEPLKTLRTFRCRPDRYGPKPVMGICLAPDSLGGVRVGDEVFVKYK
ncbi:mitochondrial amidoxime-reducing component 1-like [Saccostrea echinata]|uniref:mitochondrial amidoxime-reducing component 1-like n=1 Tax=Saccostrea echinata TaxID=191078 RepID=UPI002A80EEB6|nr:mitochondrial amidoxime-reducing component 1-like [Saccostrea echinata]